MLGVSKSSLKLYEVSQISPGYCNYCYYPGLKRRKSYELYVVILVHITAGFSDEMLELALFAVKDLRQSLKDQGCDLMIRFGNAEIVIQELVKEVVVH